MFCSEQFQVPAASAGQRQIWKHARFIPSPSAHTLLYLHLLIKILLPLPCALNLKGSLQPTANAARNIPK